MKKTLTIARRELSALFFSPIAYVVLGLFALGASLFFVLGFTPGAAATTRDTFFYLVWLLIFIAPAISMRLLSEEFRAGTFETLMTSPVSDGQVVLGKWLGAMAFFAVLMAPLILQIVVLEIVADPDYGPILTGLLGLMLVGGLYLAIGTLASAFSENQIIAFLLTVFVISVLTFMMYFLPQWNALPGWAREAAYHLNVNEQFSDFNKGLIDIRNFVYFLSGITLFLFLAIKLVESKRWR